MISYDTPPLAGLLCRYRGIYRDTHKTQNINQADARNSGGLYQIDKRMLSGRLVPDPNPASRHRGAEVLMGKIYLSRSVTAKISEEEYVGIADLAAMRDLNVSQYIRECLQRELGRRNSPGYPTILLAEVLSLRAITLNLLYRINAGDKFSKQEMLDLIQLADVDKHQKAQHRLARAGQADSIGDKHE
jgi:hypothetical protein